MTVKGIFASARGSATRRRKAKPYFPPTRHRVESHVRFEDRSLSLASRDDRLAAVCLTEALKNSRNGYVTLADQTAQYVLARLEHGRDEQA